MKNHSLDVTWQDHMLFSAEIGTHKVLMDATPEHGGHNLGPTPKPLTLASLGGCTGMDVMSLLRKMRQQVTYFNMKITGELTEEMPQYYHKIHVEYEFQGHELDPALIEKACRLSQERYCGVSALLRRGAELTWAYVIHPPEPLLRPALDPVGGLGGDATLPDDDM